MAAAAASAPAASRAPWPVPGTARARGFAVPRSSACVTSAAVSPGKRDRISAATPAVSAEDMSVLARLPYPPPGVATVRPEPGAVSAT
jgi:hypothetical protein